MEELGTGEHSSRCEKTYKITKVADSTAVSES